jgi:hypothetical protein
MSASALLREETESAVPWVKACMASLQADDDVRSSAPYLIVAAKQLVGLLLIVCVKKTCVPQIRSVKVSWIATGALGSVGNKGAIGVRLLFNHSTFCFINCHLAAHQNAVAKRNGDINTILTRLNMSPRAAFAVPGSPVQDIPQVLPCAFPLTWRRTEGGRQAEESIDWSLLPAPDSHSEFERCEGLMHNTRCTNNALLRNFSNLSEACVTLDVWN